jgi:hypothetical protein
MTIRLGMLASVLYSEGFRTYMRMKNLISQQCAPDPNCIANPPNRMVIELDSYTVGAFIPLRLMPSNNR